MRRFGTREKVLLFGSLGLMVAVLLGGAVVPASGTEFLPEVSIPLPSAFASGAPGAIAISGTQVRIAFMGQLSDLTGFDWGYAASSDGGSTFTSFRSPGPDRSPVPPNVRVVALADGSFAYVWTDGLGRLKIAVESTAGWRGPFEPLSFTLVGDDFAVAALGSDLLMTWVDLSVANGSLRLGSFTGPFLGLASWQVVDDHATALKLEPAMVVDGQDVALAWRRSTPSESAVFFAQGTFLGSLTPLAVSRDLTAPAEFHPTLAMHSNGSAFVGYADVSGSGAPVRGAFLVPPSSQFSAVFDFGSAIGGLLPSSPAIRSNGPDPLHVVWLDGNPATQTGGYRVMHTASAGSWTTFATPVRLDADPTQIGKTPPVIALGSGGEVIVAWGDARDGSGRSMPYAVRSPGPPPPPPESPLGRWLLAAALTGGGALIGGGGYALASWLRERPRKPGESRPVAKP